MVLAGLTDEANVYEGDLVGFFLAGREKNFETKLRETPAKCWRFGRFERE